MRIKRINIIGALVGGLLAMAGLTACSDSSLDDLQNGTFDSKSYLTLTFVTPSEGTPTRAATDMATRASNYEEDGYEEGIEYESTIDFDNDDYKIYFFTYATNDEKGGTLIAEFEPDEITSTEGTATTATEVTKYTLTGTVPDALENYSSFRVVVLANWGTYPEVTPNSTTIDDLCEANSDTDNCSTYAAMVSNGVATMTSATNLIPFFGVQEYTGVQFSVGTTTPLNTPVSLLRAVAKVEIIITADGSVQELNDNGASIVNYNSRGYCAPWQVYTAEDYDTSASKNPSTSQWGEEWVDGLHLIGMRLGNRGMNDEGSKSIIMYKVQEYATTDDEGNTLATPQLETWRAYVPEYDNMGEDYSYMTVAYNGDTETHNIYFAEYDAGTGKTTAYSEEETEGMPDRLNIKRNNLYRFYVTISPFTFTVYIDILPWVERRDDYEF